MAESTPKISTKKKLSRIYKELMAKCEQGGRPYYFNRTPINAMHNGNKKQFRLPLFSDLDEDTKKQYVEIVSTMVKPDQASDNENDLIPLVPERYFEKPETFYNEKGDRITFSARQEFIIMALMEVYNEQCQNVYNSEATDFMKNYWTGVIGDIVITPYNLACRLYGTDNPGKHYQEIVDDLMFLSLSRESMVLLAYNENVEKDGEIIPLPRVVYNHLIELVPNAKCLDQKERFVIRLHKGIFFTRLQKNYILLYSGITPKLTVHYGSYPPRHTLNLLEYILVAGNNKLEDGTRQCQISVANLLYILSPEDSALYKYERLNKRYQDAIKALVICNVIKDTGLDKIELKKGKENQKAVITFTIADDFFREKEEVKSLEEIPENDLILTNPT